VNVQAMAAAAALKASAVTTAAPTPLKTT
jgi:hypothetical protein